MSGLLPYCRSWSMRGVRPRVGVLLLAAVLVGASACGGEPEVVEPEPDLPAADPSPDPSPEPEPEPVLRSDALEGFEQRSVVYGNVEFTVTGARLTNQELASLFGGGEPAVDENALYAVLDITAVNQMTRVLGDLSERLYALRIDGQEFQADPTMGFRSDLAKLLRPVTSVESALAFPVPEGVDLAQAVFVIGVAPDRPAELPLTGPVAEPAYPLEVEASGSAPGVGPTNRGDMTFTVLGMTLSEDRPHEHATSPTGGRADVGELFLVVTVRAELAGERGGEHLGNAFRLLVDGVPRAPWDVADSPQGSNATPNVYPGAAVDAYVAFVIPEDATDLVLQVGAFEEDPGLIPLDLPPLP